uniref:NADH dehydrogenase subunit 6 n=1 Tax=Trissolcus basalis TaxID=32421 RepID=I3PFL5_9HYME|nr:NADH dehydrogenase subunit 6 [Trissolcus basalis]
MFLYYKIFFLFNLNMMMIFMKIKPLMILMMMIMIFIFPFNYKFINPLMINLNIIILTIWLSIYLNFINKTNWFSILIFLVMIGGMMIIFLYLNSFAINETSSINKSLMKNLELKLLILILMNLMLSKNSFFSYMIFNYINLNLKFKIYLINEPTLIMIFYKNLNYILIFMIFYLLINLIVITYICMSKKSSMRKLN